MKHLNFPSKNSVLLLRKLSENLKDFPDYLPINETPSWIFSFRSEMGRVELMEIELYHTCPRRICEFRSKTKILLNRTISPLGKKNDLVRITLLNFSSHLAGELRPRLVSRLAITDFPLT